MVAVIGFFFIGIITQKTINKENKTITSIKKALLLLIIPFFFVSIGLNFSMTALSLNLGILLIMLLIAISGKFIGSFLTKPFTKLKIKQLYLIGWAMNSRGAIEIALALIALKINAIPIEIYSALVVTALLTTISSPLAITYLIKKHPKIMNDSKK